MNRLQESIEQLKQRLPELEWKFSQLPANKGLWQLPRGIFRTKTGSPYLHYIIEIKEDIQQLEIHKQYTRQRYLARQIETKITLLIRVSVLQKKNSQETSMRHGMLQRLSSRKQWLEDLEQQISGLNQQIHAMEQQLSEYRIKNKVALHMELAQDLGQARQQLTLLKEQYQRVSSDNSRDSRP